MKILIIHTYYRNFGGEDAIFKQEQSLLNQSEEVRTLSFENKTGWRAGFYFMLSIWNIFAARRIKEVIDEYRPDVIHMHNWHFSVGPIAIWVAKRSGIPIVLTLHNFRLLCPSGTLLNKGKLFTNSIQASFPWKAIKNKVYRNSFFQTFWLAFIVWIHKKIGTWEMVNRYIVNTSFARDIFSQSSTSNRIPEERLEVNPNFVNDPKIKSIQRGDHFLFIGRLSDEKGIRILLKAFEQTNIELHIGGDGPLKEMVEKASSQNERIKYIGYIDKYEVQKVMQKCSALVFPSIWYEGMPMTIIEAFALGTPVIASNLGAMSTMIQHGFNGLHFETGNPISLNGQLNNWRQFGESEKMNYCKNAFETYQKHYTPEKNKTQLLKLYHKVISENKIIS